MSGQVQVSVPSAAMIFEECHAEQLKTGITCEIMLSGLAVLSGASRVTGTIPREF